MPIGLSNQLQFGMNTRGRSPSLSPNNKSLLRTSFTLEELRPHELDPQLADQTTTLVLGLDRIYQNAVTKEVERIIDERRQAQQLQSRKGIESAAFESDIYAPRPHMSQPTYASSSSPQPSTSSSILKVNKFRTTNAGTRDSDALLAFKERFKNGELV